MGNNQTKFEENKIVDYIKPYLDSARAGDLEHAIRVVEWVKKLGSDRADLDLLVTAAYLHDIGWSKIAPKGKINLDEMLRLEAKANENSLKLVPKILSELQFSDVEIKTITRLIVAADRHQSACDDEEIIVDADNLSKLCLEHLEQKYQPESFSKVVALWENELADRIKTQKGREVFPKLLLSLKQKIN